MTRREGRATRARATRDETVASFFANDDWREKTSVASENTRVSPPLDRASLGTEPPARARANARLETTDSLLSAAAAARTPSKKNKSISPTGFDPVTCGLPTQLFNHYGPTTLPLSYGDRWHAFTRGKKPESYAKLGRIGEYAPLKKSGICISFALIALFVFFEEARFAFFGD